MNSQQNPSLYEVLRPKIAEDIEKQMVRRFHWDTKVPGIYVGTKASVAPGLAPAIGYEEERYITSSLPYQNREGSLTPGGTWMLEVVGERGMKWETHRGGTHPLGLWTLELEKLRCQVKPGEGRSWAV